MHSSFLLHAVTSLRRPRACFFPPARQGCLCSHDHQQLPTTLPPSPCNYQDSPHGCPSPAATLAYLNLCFNTAHSSISPWSCQHACTLLHHAAWQLPSFNGLAIKAMKIDGKGAGSVYRKEERKEQFTVGKLGGRKPLFGSFKRKKEGWPLKKNKERS